MIGKFARERIQWFGHWMFSRDLVHLVGVCVGWPLAIGALCALVARVVQVIAVGIPGGASTARVAAALIPDLMFTGPFYLSLGMAIWRLPEALTLLSESPYRPATSGRRDARSGSPQQGRDNDHCERY